MHVSQLLTHAAQRYGNRTAVGDLKGSLTYAELDRLSNQFANGLLGDGLSKGDIVALALPNQIDYLVTVFGIAKAGLIATHIPYNSSNSDASQRIRHLGAKVAVTSEEFAARVNPELGDSIRWITCNAQATPQGRRTPLSHYLEHGSADPPVATLLGTDPFMIGQTSGSTGRPKAVSISHMSRVLAYLACANCFSIQSNDVQILMTPLHHGAPLDFALMSILTGGTLHVMPRFDPEMVLERAVSLGATYMFVVPTIVKRIIAHHDAGGAWQDSALTRLICNAAPLPGPTKEAWSRRLPRIGVWEAYGSTEAAWVAAVHPDRLTEKATSCGLPLPFVDLRIVDSDGYDAARGDVGTLLCRSPYLFDGYWKDEDATRDVFVDGYLVTGDKARFDDDGYVHIVGRRDDVIIMGGTNLYPREIEDALMQSPLVHDAVVIGMPDEDLGEKPIAVIQPEAHVDDWASVSFRLSEEVADRLSPYKRPRLLVFTTGFPRTESGKPIRGAISEAALGYIRGEVKPDWILGIKGTD